MNTLKKTNEILKKYQIRANKRYGQNFLIDDNVLNEICEVSDIGENDLVIEIGPGLGNLTEYIFLKCKHSMLVEIDSNMINILNDRFKDKQDCYSLLNEDILKVNIDDKIKELEAEKNIKFDNVKVVANLPYYITTPIIFKLLQESNRVEQIVVMIQKEVAERMVANRKTKEYGILTLMVKYLSDANIEIIVPNNCFIPSPDVTSAVIKLIKNKKYKVKDEDLLYKLIHLGFAQRRKKMINSLVSNKFMDKSKEELEKAFEACELSFNSRAEELELNDYIRLVDYLS